jgi:aromatic-L-amino-acid decarboxylase
MDNMTESLDPKDWEECRRTMHRLVDACLDQLEEVRQHPWKPVDQEFVEGVALQGVTPESGLEAMAMEMVNKIMPYHAGNIHPRFFGWVQGTGNVAGLMGEIVAATMNSNCGGRDHGAVYVEREVIRWCAECFGFPQGASGVLVSGTSQATVVALAVARLQALGAESRKKGIYGGPRLSLYATEGVHNAITKAVELIGIGSESIISIPVDSVRGGMDLGVLAKQVASDRAAGVVPFCVVGTAGSVDQGRFDPLEELADFCRAEHLWFHVDGAFGAWARIADEPWCDLVKGIERADSLALDFHKWMFVQYDCGLILIREEEKHRAAFAARPAYLAVQGAGIGGGDPWFCDYGTDLSRSFRALKVWATLRAYGSERLGAVVTGNCRLAALMGELVEAETVLELAAPVVSNVCCFSAVARDGEDVSRLNTLIVQRLQATGEGVFSTTKVAGRIVIRAAITNHRTGPSDIEAVIKAVVGAIEAERK